MWTHILHVLSKLILCAMPCNTNTMLYTVAVETLCCFKESSSFLCMCMCNADTPVSVSEFLKKHETEFFTVVNPRFSLMRLQRKGVISQDVVSRISAATNEKDAQEVLFAHVTHFANVNTLREYCDVIIGAKGFPNMQSFGAKMKEELQQGGKWS